MIRESISTVEHFQIVEAAFRLAAEIIAAHPPTTIERYREILDESLAAVVRLEAMKRVHAATTN